MSKAAVASLGEGLKRELQTWDVDVCTVQPVLYEYVQIWCMLERLESTFQEFAYQYKPNRSLLRTGLLRLSEVKSKFFDKDINALPENLKQDYGHEYFIGFWNMMSKFVRENANPQPEQVSLHARREGSVRAWRPSTKLGVPLLV